jgi:hypothetical protein
MSEDEGRRAAANEEASDDVEGHARPGVNDEAGDEATDDNEVEGHMRRAAPGEESARGL